LRIIIRELTFVCGPPWVWIDGYPVLRNFGLHRPLWQRPIVVHLRWAHPLPELAQLNEYPLHPNEQDMISAAGIKDQELSIIVSMMLIELALLRAPRFSSTLRCLTGKGSSYWSRCIREFGGRDARDG